jgi:hypothetical protein
LGGGDKIFSITSTSTDWSIKQYGLLRLQGELILLEQKQIRICINFITVFGIGITTQNIYIAMNSVNLYFSASGPHPNANSHHVKNEMRMLERFGYI